MNFLKNQKIVIITNIPSPYRVIQFDNLSKTLDNNLIVFYYRKIEPNRNWNVPELKHQAYYCKQNILSKSNFYPDLLKKLAKEKPNVIIAAGFTPTIVLTFLYSIFTKKKFIVFTDSWTHSTNQLKFYHRFIRKIIIPQADASICVGKKGKEYLCRYGAELKSIFTSPLAIDNSIYHSFYKNKQRREFDIIFSGQFIERKMPFFVIEVLKGLKERNYNVKLLIIGSGPLEHALLRKLDELEISYCYPGFIQQEELPKYYSNALLLLFPTTDDPWGLVANEACAAGTPVITCENAGVANDLIIHNYNGYVLPLSIEVWVDHILKLMSNSELYKSFAKNAFNFVQNFSIENSKKSIISAIKYSLKNETVK